MVDETLAAHDNHDATRALLTAHNDALTAAAAASAHAATALAADVLTVRRGVVELYGWDHYRMTMEDGAGRLLTCAYVEGRLEAALALHQVINSASWSRPLLAALPHAMMLRRPVSRPWGRTPGTPSPACFQAASAPCSRPRATSSS